MEFSQYADLIKEQKNLDMKQLSYQLAPEELEELVGILESLMMTPLPLLDSRRKPLTIVRAQTRLLAKDLKLLQTPQAQPMGLEAMGSEVYSSLKIEGVESSRDSIRQILSGQAPAGSSETGIYRMKLGLDFISDLDHEINEANLLALYKLVFQDQLPENERPSADTGYRDDAVYIRGSRMDRPLHTGMAFERLPELIGSLVEFARDPGEFDDLTVASILHFYLAWLHPWFDGNGRMARLLHLWYLVQKGYPSALYTPFSQYIEASRKRYYEAFMLCEQNQKFLGTLDVTPFVVYFNQHVYSQIQLDNQETVSKKFASAKADGKITVKETELWAFVVSAYGSAEFSTKQLEKDFGDAAYQTIYKFVHKFEELGLLAAQAYGSRKRYRIRT